MINFTRKPRYGYEDLLEIIRLLRSPEGCPWDRVQTHQSIRRGMLEMRSLWRSWSARGRMWN